MALSGQIKVSGGGMCALQRTQLPCKQGGKKQKGWEGAEDLGADMEGGDEPSNNAPATGELK